MIYANAKRSKNGRGVSPTGVGMTPCPLPSPGATRLGSFCIIKICCLSAIVGLKAGGRQAGVRTMDDGEACAYCGMWIVAAKRD